MVSGKGFRKSKVSDLRKQEEDGNLFVARGNMLNLPFPKNSFDLVCLNGVLEWVALDSPIQNPAKAQLEFLSAIKHVLRDTGCLYIGIENRFGLQYFLGAKDHDGLPFTSILPRRISNFLTKNLKKKDYETYTHSYVEYQKLLKKAGFNHVDIYWAMPSYHFPLYAGWVKDIDGFKLYLTLMWHQTKKLSKRILLKLGRVTPNFIVSCVLRSFCPDFLIFAWKRNKNTFESNLLKVVGAESFLRCGTGDSRKIRYLILKNGRVNLTIEIPKSKGELTHVIDNIREELCESRK